ncbi:MAG TPA: hypothetical protein VG713_20610 [Pirellulales bacterium]|nr:hypothetical protein [Pirellulales bacterium]
MSIAHACPRCQETLDLPPASLGLVVACPRCGASSLVADSPPPPPAPSAGRAGFGYDEVHTILEATAGPPRPPDARATPGRKSETASPGSFPPVATQSPVPAELRDMILISRRAVYAQALLFCAVAALGFAAGYAVARRTGAAASGQDTAANDSPVAVQGVVTFGPKGVLQKDVGAVIVALPVNRRPLSRLSAQGLQVAEHDGAETNAALAAIHALDGDYVRADENGAFELVVKRPGVYRLLIVSRNTLRAPRETIAGHELEEMSTYFQMPAEVIGLHRYFWKTERFDHRNHAVAQTFPATGA